MFKAAVLKSHLDILFTQSFQLSCEDTAIHVFVEPYHLLCCRRYRNEDNFGEQQFSLGAPRGGLGDRQGSLPPAGARHVGPLVFKHDHGIPDSREHVEQSRGRRGFDPDFDRPRSPPPKGSSQERFRTPDSRLDNWDEPRGARFHDNLRDPKYSEARRSPVQHKGENHIRFSNRDGPTNQRGRGGPRPTRGRSNQGQHGRNGPPRSQLHLQQSSEGFQAPEEEPRSGPDGYRPTGEDCYEEPMEGSPLWAEDRRLQQWDQDRPRSLDRHPPRSNLDPKMPRQRERAWSDQKNNNMTVRTEETLTIKVDMSRPVNQSRYCSVKLSG